MRTLLSALLLFFIPWVGAEAADKPAFTLLKPTTQTFFEEEYASVVTKIEDNRTDRLDIVVSRMGTISLAVDPAKKDVYCKTVKMNLGDNTVQIQAFAKGELLGEQNLSLFFRSEVFAEALEEPYDYKREFFHTDAKEAECKRCHNMEPDKKDENGEPTVFENPKESNCYQCHNRIVYRKNGHAPSVNFLCQECHNGRTSEFNVDKTGASKYLMPDPIVDRCFSCHENRKEVWFGRNSEHGPTKTGRCNKCHNPHSSANEFFLRKPIWKLCTTCHAEKASGTHVIKGFVFGKSHPTQGRPDPARPGRELVCSGCHNPHGSESIFLLRSKGKSAFSVCNRCHKK